MKHRRSSRTSKTALVYAEEEFHEALSVARPAEPGERRYISTQALCEYLNSEFPLTSEMRKLLAMWIAAVVGDQSSNRNLTEVYEAANNVRESQRLWCRKHGRKRVPLDITHEFIDQQFATIAKPSCDEAIARIEFRRSVWIVLKSGRE
jgi:hypothetical protein